MRYGEALSEIPRDSYVISTKVGRLLKTGAGEELDFTGMRLEDFPGLEPGFDFSRDAVLRSFEQSLQRLRLAHVNMLFLHDVPAEHFRMAIEEAFPTIAELRSQGVVSAIGAGLALSICSSGLRERATSTAFWSQTVTPDRTDGHRGVLPAVPGEGDLHRSGGAV